MNELQTKKDLIIETLKDFNLIDSFKIDELKSSRTIAFKAVHNLEKSKGIVFLIINETVYSTASIYFATLENVSKKENVLDLINNLNLEYKDFKYFINRENEIGVQISYIADSKSFNAELFINIFQAMYQTLVDETYSKFIEII
ncbi:hypothetical protein [Clostridioides difficile]|uniref:hypothetical protein n=1 Tax=Clostridioides difficile TaxID=1496 RepID=UPI00097FD848|nr:hypothetical protein [Clostridioides difficile]EIS9475090.1 hypothetical protein [Clostridioides difficile]EIS9654992.1 hypothetical protein [Clostridioides difficile]SJO68096.1 Uncharacterised protein [Clostridioides difficile]SJP02913.1 Uncharacterised protein [Clostridioides difficile]SJP11144.1 Uncharacterised protein [Clostridioides difficile]